MKIGKLIKMIISFPKTAYLNLRLFPFITAIKFPIITTYDAVLHDVVRGSCAIEGDIRTGMIQLGWGSGSVGVPGITEKTQWSVRGKIIFKGSAKLARGSSVRVDPDGELILGDHFACNKNCFLTAEKRIVIGDNATLGWNVNIRDSDGHSIFGMDDPEAKTMNAPEEVKIGNHVWICSYTDILKGVTIPNECVVAYRSCCVKSFTKENTIIAGSPAKIVRENIMWKF